MKLVLKFTERVQKYLLKGEKWVALGLTCHFSHA